MTAKLKYIERCMNRLRVELKSGFYAGAELGYAICELRDLEEQYREEILRTKCVVSELAKIHNSISE